ncbi:hypothetical protein B0H34DRAFT_677693 [Crassisporium funariophilum]|nr:hypothetical protein B0H34DRAFT_677693 [Crassisporium funariophilum]
MEATKCALNASGNRKDDNDIKFYYSKSGEHPIAPGVMPAASDEGQHQTRNAKDSCCKNPAASKRHKRHCNKKMTAVSNISVDTTQDDNGRSGPDSDFVQTKSAGNSSNSNGFEICKTEPTNAEVMAMEEVNDVDSAHHISKQSQMPTNPDTILEDANLPEKKKAKVTTKDPIYFFYESVACGADGSVRNPGD